MIDLVLFGIPADALRFASSYGGQAGFFPSTLWI